MTEGVAKILYLEDDQALAMVTKRGLEKRGFIVYWLQSIDEVINVLDNFDYTYVVLDLKIGNQTSLSLIAKIRAASSVPIVILTGYGTIQTAVQAMRLGAVDFLTKPCGIEAILTALTDSERPIVDHTDVALEKQSLKSVEWETIQRALDENQGNVSAAARQLKMHRRTLQRKLQKKHLLVDG